MAKPALTAVRDEDTAGSTHEAFAALIDLDEAAPTTDLMRVYLDEIGRIPLLTAEQEVEVSKRIEAGVYAAELLRRHEAGEARLTAARRRDLASVARDGQAAKEHMLRANLRLVVSVAKKYSHGGLPLLDLVQDGNVGLVRAVEKFDYAKGFKFSTYATWWIRQAVGRGLAEQGRAVRLPSAVDGAVMKVMRAQRDLTLQLGRHPSDAEIAQLTGGSAERVADLRRLGRDPASLDARIGENGAEFGDLVADASVPSPDDAFEQRELVEQLDRTLGELPELQAAVVRRRYGLHDGRRHTLDEVGRHVGLTREQVRKLERQAMDTLRDPGCSAPLRALAS